MSAASSLGPLEKFTTYGKPDRVTAVRIIAVRERRSFYDVVDEALALLVASREASTSTIPIGMVQASPEAGKADADRKPVPTAPASGTQLVSEIAFPDSGARTIENGRRAKRGLLPMTDPEWFAYVRGRLPEMSDDAWAQLLARHTVATSSAPEGGTP